MPRRTRVTPPTIFEAYAKNGVPDATAEEIKKLRAEVRLLRKKIEEWSAWCELAVNRPWDMSKAPRSEIDIPF